MATQQKAVSKKRKFVADGVFYSELNEFLTRVLGEDGYAGVEIRVTPIRTEIIVSATRKCLLRNRFHIRNSSSTLFYHFITKMPQFDTLDTLRNTRPVNDKKKSLL